MTPVIQQYTAYSFRDIQEDFKEKVKVYALDMLGSEEQSVMLNAIEAVALSCREENVAVRKTSIVITRNGHIEFFDDPTCKAEAVRLIIIKTESMKDLDATKKMICYVEEMCHILWNVDDEIEVKYIVTRVINRYYGKNFNIYDLYSREWIEENK